MQNAHRKSSGVQGLALIEIISHRDGKTLQSCLCDFTESYAVMKVVRSFTVVDTQNRTSNARRSYRNFHGETDAGHKAYCANGEIGWNA